MNRIKFISYFIALCGCLVFSNISHAQQTLSGGIPDLIISGNLVDATTASILLKQEYTVKKNVMNVSTEDTPTWKESYDLTQLYRNTNRGINRGRSVEQAISFAYMRHAQESGINIKQYSTDPAFVNLVQLLTL